MNITGRSLRGACTLAAAILLLAAAPAFASSFSIAPIRVELDRAHRTGALTIRNPSDESVVIQVTAVAWSQTDGEDHYEDTHDLLATPPVFEVAAQGEQIVRVALRRDVDANLEQAYRVYFEEVPQARTANYNALNVALRVSLPVFIAPAGARPTPNVTWSAKWLADGKLELSGANHGSAHLQVTDFDLGFGNGETLAHAGGSKYILPGSEMHWTIDAPAAAHGGAVHLKGLSDNGELAADITPTGP